MTAWPDAWSEAAGVRAARGLMVALAVAMMVSTSVAVGLEIACYVLFLVHPALRARVAAALRQPAAIALLAFLALVALATLHGLVPFGERAAALFGWRTAFLFPLALAVFDTAQARMLLLVAVVAACTVAAVASDVLFVTGLEMRRGQLPGTALHNHATQGLLFAVAALGAALLAWREAPPRHRAAAALACAILLTNIVFVTPGRSGYLALVVMAVVFALALDRARIGRRIAIGAAFAAAIAGGFMLSGPARERFDMAVTEIETYEAAPEMTSMGHRVVMLNHTLASVKENWLVGVGTGSFRAAYAASVRGENGWRAEVARDPHNQFLWIWAEQGVFGLAAFLVFLASVAATALRAREPPYSQLALCVLAAWCATSLFSSHFSTAIEGRFIFLWLGAMLARPATPGPAKEEDGVSAA